jgi:hypothetical protein
MNVHVHIERVVLDGLSIPVRDIPDLQAAIEAELTHQFIAHGLAPALLSGAALPHLAADAVRVTSMSTAQLGSDIGRAAFGVLGNSDSSGERI